MFGLANAGRVISLGKARDPRGDVMATISITLSDAGLDELRTRSAHAGLTPEAFLSRHAEQLLERPDEAFQQAAAYVLAKNAELYRRLA